MSWTDERIQELTSLWQAGHSASEIGKRLSVSKNAVVGKAHRLGLPSRPSPIKQGEAKGEKASAKPRKSAQATSVAPLAASTQPETAQPKTAQPKTAQPKTAQPKTAQPETVQPATAQPATAKAVTPKTESEAPAVQNEAIESHSPANEAKKAAPPDAARASAAAQAKPEAAPSASAATSPGAAKPTVKESGKKAKSGRSLKSVGGGRSGGRYPTEGRGMRSGCLWPFGDPGDADFHFCGADCVPGKPYCAEHAARAYITRSRDRDEEAA